MHICTCWHRGQVLSPFSLPSVCFCKACVENAGRSAAAALAQVVKSTACAFKAGHSMDRLRLEVEHGGFGEVDIAMGSASLTETDKQYRRKFLDTVRHAILQPASAVRSG